MSDHSEVSGLQSPPEFVPLRDVALACFMFDSLTSYNKSLRTFRKAIHGELDISLPGHPGALLKWLNDWGCRHLAVDQHGVASDSILRWYKAEREKLGVADKPLWLLDDGELKQAAEAYGALKDLPGAKRIRGGKAMVATIGPTAASKVLFAYRPEAFAPWDDVMRKHFRCDGSAESYQKFLGIVRDLALEIAAECERNDFPMERLPKKLDRSNSTVVALLNEYLWVTVSRERTLPPKETLALWTKW